MRITGGSCTGRKITVPEGEVRPTQDRVRESLFGMLLQCLDGSRCLDLFAGSGSLGIEALSRGAGFVQFVDQSAAGVSTIRKNLRTLKMDEACWSIQRDSAWSVVDEPRSSGTPYDIIFADPPYIKGAYQEGNEPLSHMLHSLLYGNVLRPGGLFIFEQDAGSPVWKSSNDWNFSEGMAEKVPMIGKKETESSSDWNLLRDRMYGKTRLLIYRKERGDG
ncbi:MAG: 16S rRNA (guanine(966)-N(2))-methyltransferase RsmD [Spartobacteria bacterium]|nr:16S rRNA (guanine(966)-N(2))-methyltransferase RsmD [Spartobacteria bacterium]